MRDFHKILMDNRGETLLEVVMSIGLFALMMLMVATMFTVANKSMARNIETDEHVDAVVSMLAEADVSDLTVGDGKGTEYTVTSTPVSITVTSGGTTIFSTDSNHKVNCISVEGLYKYVYTSTP